MPGRYVHEQVMSSGNRKFVENHVSSTATDNNAHKHVDDSVAALIDQVGQRVIAARKAKHLSRRELSELSGVSPSYIVRLESGEGNISIGLLQRIAVAIERPIEWLVATDDALTEDIARLIVRYRNASAATRSSVLNLLDPDQLREQKAQRICLIGLRGAGKSTLGARLSESVGLPFIELNHEIEKAASIPVAEIIAMYGDEGYRKLEADTLNAIISTRSRLILAVAGGVVEEPDTFGAILSRFHSIWLKASPNEHMDRVREQGDMRPMRGNPQAMDQLREILDARESRYAQADYQLNTSGKNIDVSLAELCALVESHKMLS